MRFLAFLQEHWAELGVFIVRTTGWLFVHYASKLKLLILWALFDVTTEMHLRELHTNRTPMRQWNKKSIWLHNRNKTLNIIWLPCFVTRREFSPIYPCVALTILCMVGRGHFISSTVNFCGSLFEGNRQPKFVTFALVPLWWEHGSTLQLKSIVPTQKQDDSKGVLGPRGLPTKHNIQTSNVWPLLPPISVLYSPRCSHPLLFLVTYSILQ